MDRSHIEPAGRRGDLADDDGYMAGLMPGHGMEMLW